MLLADAGFCAQTSNIWNLVGYVVMIFKIVIPLILIILGMVDLGKAVVSSDEKAINKAVSSLIKRFIAAVVIFFVPTLVSALFNILDIMNVEDTADYNICVQCVTDQSKCKKYLVCAKGSKYYTTDAACDAALGKTSTDTEE